MKIKLGDLARVSVIASAFALSTAQATDLGDLPSSDELNLIGLGVASTPDFMGSSENTAAPVPIVRYQFAGSQRYFRWVGPNMELNLLDDPDWRLGPMLTFRPKRDDDVDDAVVKQMDELDSETEFGAFVEYRYRLSQMKGHQVVFNLHVTGSSEGTIGGPKVVYSYPASPEWLLTIGIGMDFADSDWMEHYFGITSAHDIALYPSLGGQQFKAESGMKSFYIPFGATYTINKEWLMSVGGRYEQLQSDAKDSPIVEQHGDDKQWTVGLAFMYKF